MFELDPPALHPHELDPRNQIFPRFQKSVVAGFPNSFEWRSTTLP
jgi:hypothetical protein